MRDSLLRTVPLHATDSMVINVLFYAERVAAPGRLQASFADGWHAQEQSAGARWRWSDGQGRIRLTNSSATPVRATLRMTIRGVAPGRLELRLAEHVVATRDLDGTDQDVLVENLLLPAGDTVLSLKSDSIAGVSATDSRRLGVALSSFELRTVSLEN